jgi:hypothetical protein
MQEQSSRARSALQVSSQVPRAPPRMLLVNHAPQGGLPPAMELIAARSRVAPDVMPACTSRHESMGLNSHVNSVLSAPSLPYLVRHSAKNAHQARTARPEGQRGALRASQARNRRSLELLPPQNVNIVRGVSTGSCIPGTSVAIAQSAWQVSTPTLWGPQAAQHVAWGSIPPLSGPRADSRVWHALRANILLPLVQVRALLVY